MPEKLKLKVMVKEVYGVPKIYPANKAAAAIAKIAGSKTLAPKVLGVAMAELGMQLEVDGSAQSMLVAKMVAAATPLILDELPGMVVA